MSIEKLSITVGKSYVEYRLILQKGIYRFYNDINTIGANGCVRFATGSYLVTMLPSALAKAIILSKSDATVTPNQSFSPQTTDPACHFIFAESVLLTKGRVWVGLG